MNHNGLLGKYEEVAQEYYNALRHPTCANFREASKQLLTRWLRHWLVDGMFICETGAGKSLVAQLLWDVWPTRGRLILVDSSPGMLEHSTFVRSIPLSELILADARELPIPSNRADIVVASLGDPYNCEDFWREARRVLKTGGAVLFTTPSFDWAVSFRGSHSNMMGPGAEFELEGGRRLIVPSLIYTESEETSLIRSCGMTLKEVCQVPLSALGHMPLSPKLGSHRGPRASVVTGYVAVKRNFGNLC